MSTVTTHVLDLAAGRPAAGVAVRLDRQGPDGSWQPLGEARTDADGRVREWPSAPSPVAGVHRLTFATGAYFASSGQPAFHPEVSVAFHLDPAGHHHVPLLLSPFGYTTYRGT